MRKVLIAVAIGLILSILLIGANKAFAYTDVHCKSASDTHQWGVWPAAQFVTDHTYWCWGVNSNNVRVITYRTDSVTAHGNEVGGLCEPTATRHWLLSSDTNYRYWEDEGDFKCATNLPGVYLYPHDKMKIWVNAEGQYCGPDNCPCYAKHTCVGV